MHILDIIMLDRYSSAIYIHGSGIFQLNVSAISNYFAYPSLILSFGTIH